MSATPELDRLCAHYGIAATYEDVEGRRHQAGNSTRRALLRALGVACGDPATEEQSLAETINKEWQRVLAPVIVHREGDEVPMLALSLPDQPELMEVRLVLTEESGTTTEAELDLDRLSVEEQREIDGQHWQRRTIAVPGADRDRLSPVIDPFISRRDSGALTRDRYPQALLAARRPGSE